MTRSHSFSCLILDSVYFLVIFGPCTFLSTTEYLTLEMALSDNMWAFLLNSILRTLSSWRSVNRAYFEGAIETPRLARSFSHKSQQAEHTVLASAMERAIALLSPCLVGHLEHIVHWELTLTSSQCLPDLVATSHLVLPSKMGFFQTVFELCMLPFAKSTLG